MCVCVTVCLYVCVCRSAKDWDHDCWGSEEERIQHWNGGKMAPCKSTTSHLWSEWALLCPWRDSELPRVKTIFLAIMHVRCDDVMEHWSVWSWLLDTCILLTFHCTHIQGVGANGTHLPNNHGFDYYMVRTTFWESETMNKWINTSHTHRAFLTLMMHARVSHASIPTRPVLIRLAATHVS